MSPVSTADAERRARGLAGARALRPFHVLAKPSGPLCNLDCGYCFYLEKRALYPGTRSFRMSDSVLERFVEQYIAAQPRGAAEVAFGWQGGEPTLMGIPFFERVLELQRRHVRPGMKIQNALQTNATLLDDDWGRFLAAHGFLVGVSVDGPESIHDAQRRDGRGRGSFAAVMQGLDVLVRHGVEFNTLTVLHRDNCGDPAGLYDFLERIGSRFMQFIPIVEHAQGLAAKGLPGAIGGRLADAGSAVSRRSIEPRQWGACLNGLFDRWLECDDVGEVFVQLFDVVLGIVSGHGSALCVHAERCGHALAIEHNGDVYACDHYVSPEYGLGNIAERSLVEMLADPRQRRFGDDKSRELPGYCRRCRYLELCWGACPKDRIATTPDGERGLAHLCQGYKAFYRHSLPVFRAMADCLEQGRPPRDYRLPPAETGRNAPCPCGSGVKYKRCCWGRSSLR